MIKKKDLNKYKSPGISIFEPPPWSPEIFIPDRSDKEKLDSIDIEVIERYIRKKKLEKLNEDKR